MSVIRKPSVWLGSVLFVAVDPHEAPAPARGEVYPNCEVRLEHRRHGWLEVQCVGAPVALAHGGGVERIVVVLMRLRTRPRPPLPLPPLGGHRDS
eukprot:14638763-Alexandrium_andersonii.AAC.1